MIPTDILCGGFLLSAFGVIGAAINGFLTAAEETSTSQTDPVNSRLDEIAQIRAFNQVTLLDASDEGLGILHLPKGVYGYSWSPQAESPLYRKKSYQNFEVHLAADGEIYIIGFLTAEEFAKLATSRDEFYINLYPEPYDQADRAVSIPRSQILAHKAPARDHGNALKLKLAPATPLL